MKSFKSVLRAFFAAVALFTLPGYLIAGSNFSVNVGTVVPNGSVNGAAAFTAAAYPNISGGAYLRKLTVTNSGTVDRVQIFDACSSSTTASAELVVVAKASDTVTLDFLPQAYKLTNPCIYKTNLGDNTIRATFFYE